MVDQEHFSGNQALDGAPGHTQPFADPNDG
jgi:hypothetical protein